MLTVAASSAKMLNAKVASLLKFEYILFRFIYILRYLRFLKKSEDKEYQTIYFPPTHQEGAKEASGTD